MITRKQTGDWFDQCDAMLKRLAEIEADTQELSQIGSRYGDDGARLARQAKTASGVADRLGHHLRMMLQTASDLMCNVMADETTARAGQNVE